MAAARICGEERSLTYLVKGINVLIMDVPQGSVPKTYWKPYQSSIYGLIGGKDAPAFLKFLDYIPVAALVLAARRTGLRTTASREWMAAAAEAAEAAVLAALAQVSAGRADAAW